MIKINLHHLSPLFCELVAAQVNPRHSCAGCHLNHNHNHNHDENNGIAFHHNAIWLILMMCWIHLRVRRSRTASHDAKPNLITESESEKVKKSPCVIFSCPNSSMPTLVIIMHIGCYRFKAFRPFRPNRNLAKLMGVMKKHDLTNKNITTKTNAKTKTMTMTIIFREYLQRAIFDTFDL